MIQGIVQLVCGSVVSLRPKRDSTFTRFLSSLHPYNVFSDEVDVGITAAQSAGRADSNGPSAVSIVGLPKSSTLEPFPATARLVERAPVAYLFKVLSSSRRWREPGPIETARRADRHLVTNITRVAAVALEEDVSGVFFFHLRDVRRICGRKSILKLVARYAVSCGF